MLSLGGWCHTAAGIGRQKKPRDSQEGFLPATPLRTGHISISISCCFASPESPPPPFCVTCKRKSSWKVKNAAPSFRCVFLRVACLVDVSDCRGDGLTFELFINTFQPTQVGHIDRVRRDAGWLSTQFRKYSRQPGELCPLKGNLVLTHTPQAYISERCKADSRLLN